MPFVAAAAAWHGILHGGRGDGVLATFLLWNLVRGRGVQEVVSCVNKIRVMRFWVHDDIRGPGLCRIHFFRRPKVPGGPGVEPPW